MLQNIFISKKYDNIFGNIYKQKIKPQFIIEYRYLTLFFKAIIIYNYLYRASKHNLNIYAYYLESQ